MCYVVYAPRGAEIEISWFEAAVSYNNCGFGVAIIDDNRPQVVKFLRFEPFLEKVASLPSDVDRLIHMRFATKGKISLENTQPILLGSRVIAHNGTIRDFGNENVSDSVDFSKRVLSKLSWKELVGKRQELEKFLGYSKIVVAEVGKTLILNERLGTWNSGCWHSTDEFLAKDPNCSSSDYYDESFVVLDAILRLKKIKKDWRLPDDLQEEIQEVIDTLNWVL